MYVTLPSNTEDFSTNTTSSFRVKLPNPLAFAGDWEVALTEIQYPISWNTIKNMEGRIFLMYQHYDYRIPVEIRIQQGHYHNIVELSAAIDAAIENAGMHLPSLLFSADLAIFRMAKLKFMNPPAFAEWNAKAPNFAKIIADPLSVPAVESDAPSRLQKKYWSRVEASDELRKKPPEGNMLTEAFKVKYANNIKRVQIEWLSEAIKAVTFDKPLQFILGFDKATVLHHGINTADYNVDISGAETSFFVYCNIVQPQFVGNSLKQLLRTVPVATGALGNTIHKEFITPHYIGVLANDFDTLEIEIRNDFGKLVDFQFGKIIAKLHFRRKPLLNL